MVHIIPLLILLFTIPSLNKKYPFWIFSFLTMFLYSALRYDFGPDYMEYYNIFNSIHSGVTSWGQSDLLYKQLNLLLPSFFILISLLSLFYTLSIGNLIRTNLRVKDYWFSFLILFINPYLYLIHQSSLRQTISICIVIWAVNFIVKKKLLKFSLLILVASGFHVSAIVVYPFYFIINEKKIIFSRKLLIIVGGGVLLLTPLFDLVANKMLEFLPIHYTFYYEQGLENSLRATLLSSLYFFVVLLNINKLQGREIVYGKLSLVSTIISVLAMRVSMLTRVGMYFDVFLIITLPQIFNRIEKKIHKFTLFSMLMLIYILRYFSFFTNPIWSTTYSVYKTILNRY